LCAHLVEAVGRVEPGFGENLRGMLQNPGADFDDVVLPRAVEALAAQPRDTVVVLDDYHLLEVDFQEKLLSYLLRSLPAAVQLVVSTRTEPPVQLGRLRAIRELVDFPSGSGFSGTRDQV
jgi:LuxR family transcriptional regulator, maltose regulon positive regulatory protein